MAACECGADIERRGSRGPWPTRCPSCKTAHNKQYQQRHHVEHNRANPDVLAKRRAYQREWQRAKGADVRRAEKLQYRYGLTPERLAEMLAAQGGACAFCLQTFESPRAINVDHDHRCCDKEPTCGRCVRFLLCGPCNKGIAHFREDPAALRRAADALERLYGAEAA